MEKIPQGFDLLGAPVNGFYSQAEQYWIIRPQSEWEHDPARQWLCIGGPGVDRIEFGLRQGQVAVYAYYPIDDEFIEKAASVPSLIQGWFDGSITV
jgi:hypothetical protein